jgi:hypothetical protein
VPGTHFPASHFATTTLSSTTVRDVLVVVYHACDEATYDKGGRSLRGEDWSDADPPS